MWIFDPCNDSTQRVNDLLTEKSFIVQDMSNDLGFTSLRNVSGFGTKVEISFYDETLKSQVKGEIEYLYCRLTVNAVGPIKILEQCDYLVDFGVKTKFLSCVYFDNYVIDVEPLDPTIRDKYLQSFVDRNWPLPEWAQR